MFVPEGKEAARAEEADAFKGLVDSSRGGLGRPGCLRPLRSRGRVPGVGVTRQQVFEGRSLGFPSTFWFLYPLLLFESNHFPLDSGYTFLCFVVVVIVGFNQQCFVIVGFNFLNVSRPLDLPVSQSSKQVPQSNRLSSLAHGCLELEPGSVRGTPMWLVQATESQTRAPLRYSLAKLEH